MGRLIDRSVKYNFDDTRYDAWQYEAWQGVVGPRQAQCGISVCLFVEATHSFTKTNFFLPNLMYH